MNEAPERFLLTGSRGQLGLAFTALLGGEGAAFGGGDLPELDIDDRAAIERALDAVPGGPATVLLNAAAYTNVDGCERDPALARRVNAQAPAALASLCEERGVRFVHVSTDYVFDGKGSTPLREDDPVNPLSEYGRSKREGEQAVLAASSSALVARTSWVFGEGQNFLRAICARAHAIRSGEAQGPLRVVDDQVGCPTYAPDLAAGILGLLRADVRGLFHLCNAGAVDRFTLASYALECVGLEEVAMEAVPTSAFPLPAERPLYTVLDTGRAAGCGVTLRPWREAVAAYLETLELPR